MDNSINDLRREVMLMRRANARLTDWVDELIAGAEGIRANGHMTMKLHLALEGIYAVRKMKGKAV